MNPGRPILYVSPYYPPFGAGGAERTASLHARILARAGHSVIVVTPNFGAAADETVDGVRIIRVEIGNRLKQGGQIPERAFDQPDIARRLRTKLEAVAAETDACCIHAQHPAVVAIADRAARRRNIPLVAHVRDTGLICAVGAICLMEPGIDNPPRHCTYGDNMHCRTDRWNRIYDVSRSPLDTLTAYARGTGSYARYRWRLRHFANARRIAFASQALLDLYARTMAFEDRSRLRVVYAPVLEPSESVPDIPLPAEVEEARASGHPLILFAGKISKGKGADVMFSAAKRLAQSNPEARLVVCGNLHPGAWDFDKARTILLGFVDQVLLARLYAACDIVLLPSTWPEPLGWSTLDAGRHGKPVVATRVGGIPEAILDGQTGLLVEKGDAAAMARALARLLDDRDLAVNMGRRAREQIETRFGENAVRQQLAELYQDLS